MDMVKTNSVNYNYTPVKFTIVSQYRSFIFITCEFLLQVQIKIFDFNKKWLMAVLSI